MKETLLLPYEHKGSKDYFESLFANRLDNWEETNKFLKTYNLPKLNYEEIENWTITSKGIESVIKNLPAKKSPRPGGFAGGFRQTLKEELIPVLKLFQKLEEEGTLWNSWGHCYPHSKAGKGHHKKIIS